MKTHKAAGPDTIPAEVLKLGGRELQNRLHRLTLRIWQLESMPADLRNAKIVSIFKKGDKADCDNYRGISLLSVVGKVIARIILQRITPLAEAVLPESQSGFRPSRGTLDMIFVLRQIQEKCREQQQPLYVTFFDLTKAFDSIHRETLWQILLKYGCPNKLVSIIRLFHDNMTATVICDSGETDAFPVKVGVKQGCVTAPTLFLLFMGAVLQLAEPNLNSGIEIRFRTDGGGIFNLRRLRANTKVQHATVVELQYADDTAVCSTSEEGLQSITTAFSHAYSILGLTLNTMKTETLFQPADLHSNEHPQPKIVSDGKVLKCVDTFKYLGSNISTKAVIDDEITHRISSAAAAFGRLNSRVFLNRDLTTSTKLKVYNAVVIPTLLYGSEAWTTYKRHVKTLEKYHLRCLRSILRIKWDDFVSNNEVLDRASTVSIESVIVRNRLRWAGMWYEWTTPESSSRYFTAN